MTYHRDYMLTPFFDFPGRFWSSPSDRGEGRKEWLRLKRTVEVEGMRAVIRWCQRAATGRVRGQLPRKAPGICGVEGTLLVQMIIIVFLGGKREKREREATAGSVVGSKKRERGGGDVIMGFEGRERESKPNVQTKNLGKTKRKVS